VSSSGDLCSDDPQKLKTKLTTRVKLKKFFTVAGVKWIMYKGFKKDLDVHTVYVKAQNNENGSK